MNRNVFLMGLHRAVLAPSGFVATRMNCNRSMWASESRSKATHMVHGIAAYKLSATGPGVGRRMNRGRMLRNHAASSRLDGGIWVTSKRASGDRSLATHTLDRDPAIKGAITSRR